MLHKVRSGISQLVTALLLMSVFLEGVRNQRLATLRLFTVQANSVAFGPDSLRTIHVLVGSDPYAKKCTFFHLNSFYSFDASNIIAAYLAGLPRESLKADCLGIRIKVKKDRAGAEAK
jgi:hypothetical protein